MGTWKVLNINEEELNLKFHQLLGLETCTDPIANAPQNNHTRVFPLYVEVPCKCKDYRRIFQIHIPSSRNFVII